MPARPRPSTAPTPPIPSPYVARRLPGAPGPSGIRIATWNINSVRLRLPLVKKLIKAAQPDIICLQETKTEDQHFPAEALAKAGYPHQCFYGMKGYNGVAILSRHALSKNGRERWCEQGRFAPRAGRAAGRHRAAQRLHPRGRRHP